MADAEEAMKVVGCSFLVLLAVTAIIFGPFLTLWCVYTIWDMPEVAQVYDFWHWLAAFCFSGAVGGAFAGVANGLKQKT